MLDPDELSNASIRDKSYLQKKLDFCQHYVEMHEDFSDKELPNLGNVRSTLAETYYQLEEKEADRFQFLFKGQTIFELRLMI